MKFANTASGKSLSKDPAVVKHNGSYFLYHSVPSKEYFNGWSIGIAKSVNLVDWEVVGELLPVDDCEKNGLCAPGAIVLDGTVHLFYQTYGNGARDAICHAVSTDGITFSRDPSNPVFRPKETWCCGRAIDADVCVFGGRLHMYFATRDHNMEIQKVGGAWAELSSDFSAGSWTPLSDGSLLCPELVWEGKCIEAPACICHGDKLYMFYGGSYNCTPQQIGCAVSSDGKFFERISDKPFLPNGKKDEWNESESGHPFVFQDADGRIYLFFQGSADGGKSWYISKTEIAFKNGIPFILKDGEK